jgi:hypothetical protein
MIRLAQLVLWYFVSDSVFDALHGLTLSANIVRKNKRKRV